MSTASVEWELWSTRARLVVTNPAVPRPPATSTLLLDRRVAVWPVRAETIEPVGLQVPDAGS